MKRRNLRLLVLAAAMQAFTSTPALAQFDKLLAGDAEPDDNFGYALSISGSTAVVGAWQNDSLRGNSGAAYVYERASGSTEWAFSIKLIPDDDSFAGDEFGKAVDIDRNWLIVGAQFDDEAGNDRGAAYMFRRTPNGPAPWTRSAKLTANDPAFRDFFGRAVAISGTRVVVGAPEDDDNGAQSGSAYVFELDLPSGTWEFADKLVAPDGVGNDEFGTTVDIAGDTIVVGAGEHGHSGVNDTGGAYVFRRGAGGNWNFEAELLPVDRDELDNFGLAVAIDRNRIVVGAPFDDDDETVGGSAYVFERAPGTSVWNETAKLNPIDASLGDEFGHAVAIAGGQVVVASLEDDDLGNDSGSAYIFQRDPVTGAWSERDKINANDSAAFDEFGFAVAMHAGVALIGAPEDDDQSSDESGSAYLFQLPTDPNDIIFDDGFGNN